MTEREIRNREYLRTTKPLAYTKVMKYEEQLANGKSIAMIQLNPSYVCNFSCSHCSISSFRKQKKPIMSSEDIRRVYNESDAYGLAQTDIVGGEPLSDTTLPQTIEAIGTDRFYVSLATNGWFLDGYRAGWLKSKGIDRILISIDSLNATEHDTFRNRQGSHKRAVGAMKHVKEAGMDLHVNSVITHERVRSTEFREFLKFLEDNGAVLSPQPAKPVGSWTGRTDILLTDEDREYLVSEYGIQLHTSKHFGVAMGCLAVKKIIAITAFGDVMPCIWMYRSLGNVMNTPLAEIIDKGMKLYGYTPNCRMQDLEFLSEYNKEKHL